MSQTIIKTINDAFFDEFNRIRRKVDGVSGDKQSIFVTHTATAISIRGGPVATSPPSEASQTARRYKIKTAADTNGVAVCNTWDGTTAGTTDINVLVTGHRGVGEVLFAMTVTPNAGVQKDSKDVVYLEYVTNPLFPVKVTKTTGDAGTKTTVCTYLYNVFNAINTVQIGTNMTPVMLRRGVVGKFDPAQSGMGCYVGGTFMLWDIDERAADGDC